MLSGVYIGRSDQASYDLISTGDYLNPISPVFKLKDTKTVVKEEETLFLIVNDIELEMIKVEVRGVMSMVRVFLSWDRLQWTTTIQKNEQLNAIGTLVKIPFYIKTVVDDFLEYFEISGSNSYKQFKIRLAYV